MEQQIQEEFTENLMQNIIASKEAMLGLQGQAPVTTQIKDGWRNLIPIIQFQRNQHNVPLYNVGKWFRDLQSSFKQSSKSLKESNNFYMQSQTNKLLRIGEGEAEQLSSQELEEVAEKIAEGACVGEVIDPLGQSINLDIFEEIINKLFRNKYIMRWFFQNNSDYESQLQAQWQFLLTLLNQQWVEQFIFEKAYRTDANNVAKSDLVQMGCAQLKFKEYKQRVETRLSTMEEGPQKKREQEALNNRIETNRIKKEAALALEKQKMKSIQRQKESKSKTKFEQKKAQSKRKYDENVDIDNLINAFKQQDEDDIMQDMNEQDQTSLKAIDQLLDTMNSNPANDQTNEMQVETTTQMQQLQKQKNEILQRYKNQKSISKTKNKELNFKKQKQTQSMTSTSVVQDHKT